MDGMARLDRYVRAVEARHSPEADFDETLRHEHRISESLNGRTVFDDRQDRQKRRRGQLPLFER
jgi:hypothetical protein